MRSYGVSPDTVTMKIDVDDIPMDMDLSVPIGLIITELVSNALKHGFPDGRRGLITIRMRRVEARMLMLAVGDDGVGWPADIDYRRPASLGLRIVNILAEQIHANLVLDMGAGTTFTLTFPAG